MPDNNTDTVEKTFSISKGEYVDKPADTTETKTDDTATNVVDDAGKKIDAAAAGATTTADTTKTVTTKIETPAAGVFVPGEYIKSKFGTYGVDTEEELEGVLKSTLELSTKYDELQKKAAEPIFRTDQEKRVAEFLKDYDPSKFGEGLTTAAAIMGMDPDAVSGKVAMQEKFILEHPHLTRDEAKDWFDDEYAKYHVDKEKFDDDAAYEKQKRIMDIKLKDEETRSRSFLKEQKQKLKSTDKPETTTTKFELDKPTVEGYTREIEKFLPTFDKIEVKDEDGKAVVFNVVLDKEKQKDIKTFMMRHIQNQQAYGDDKKIANFAAPQLAKTALRLLHGDWLEAQMVKQIKTLAAVMKAEDISGRSPENKSGGGAGASDVKLSQTDQFMKLGEKAAETRKR